MSKRIDDQDWQRILDKAGYGLPDSDKPKAEITTGLIERLTQQNQKPTQSIDNIFDALRSMTEKK